ncbi:hypothetical protein N7448_007368 [Penicillium atrosanguineum]|uniref:CipC protein n=1 Tax=Penicillium atrosanguineum TaxID=1132637 RepID=A0A9W9KY30_9EURO|nr:uncharacterized protein N7443_001605 [Penicillium atrosanguineum]KAJ5126589.1 hypothetical protein N7448_007368 [Penicillium atrosanguineum]KAJ5146790.1 hypothetical protein N7526_000142 [Penicillium atrosanguineum]KAJ5314721.1 hypothetical protein N7443_001605 [Penicillium atrosanguineum]KAJ5331891.1 hypothetical protein N7476_001674 [Penicillium atrosanguineum]
MGWFSDDSDQSRSYEQYNQGGVTQEHDASFSHELIAGAASYEAAKAYEEHCERNGQPESHDKAKEIMAGFAGAFIDREVETKGLDFIDREKAKRASRQHIDDISADQVGY